jgi:hypothetical protein
MIMEPKYLQMPLLGEPLTALSKIPDSCMDVEEILRRIEDGVFGKRSFFSLEADMEAIELKRGSQVMEYIRLKENALAKVDPAYTPKKQVQQLLKGVKKFPFYDHLRRKFDELEAEAERENARPDYISNAHRWRRRTWRQRTERREDQPGGYWWTWKERRYKEASYNWKKISAL